MRGLVDFMGKSLLAVMILLLLKSIILVFRGGVTVLANDVLSQ